MLALILRTFSVLAGVAVLCLVLGGIGAALAVREDVRRKRNSEAAMQSLRQSMEQIKNEG